MEGTAQSNPGTPGYPHLGPLFCALAAMAALLAGVQTYVSAQMAGRLPFYAAHAMSFKVNGNVLQSVAFRTPSELPIYGSSELDYPADNRPDAFFSGRPTGFAVFPVGRGGATTFLIQQKLAAIGDVAHGKRVVIFLSPIWFLQSSVTADAVNANLGIPQLSAWIFGENLSPALKTDLARRMLDFPGRLENQALLAATVRCLAEPTPWHRFGLALLHPLGKLQNTAQVRFDYGVILWEMIFPQARWSRPDGQPTGAPPPPTPGPIRWDERIARAEVDDQRRGSRAFSNSNATERDRAETHPKSDDPDQSLAAQLHTSREFADLALLLRVLKELQMEALFISQPFNALDKDLAGTTAAARRAYYERLHAMLRAAGYSVRDFSDHESDRSFFNDGEHPSAKAWLFYDREIDEFYARSAG